VTKNSHFATKQTLVGQFVMLRPFTEADLPAMREALLDADARILTGSVHDAAAAHAPQSPDEEKLLAPPSCPSSPPSGPASIPSEMTARS
jgi:hypothetical protein